MPRVLAGGPTRETKSAVFRTHVEGLDKQRDGFSVEIMHEVVPDPGGARWEVSKIERVASVRQVFMDRGIAYDALLMVDSDVILGPGTLLRMWEVDAPVVYGVYWTHADWGGPVADYPQVWDINPYGWTKECADELRAPGVNEVEVFGGGACTLIRGDGFSSHYHPLLLSISPYRNMWAGEDRTYCLGLECRGIKQVAVTGLPIHHCYDIADQTVPALARIKAKVGL